MAKSQTKTTTKTRAKKAAGGAGRKNGKTLTAAALRESLGLPSIEVSVIADKGSMRFSFIHDKDLRDKVKAEAVAALDRAAQQEREKLVDTVADAVDRYKAEAIARLRDGRPTIDEETAEKHRAELRESWNDAAERAERSYAAGKADALRNTRVAKTLRFFGQNWGTLLMIALLVAFGGGVATGFIQL